MPGRRPGRAARHDVSGADAAEVRGWEESSSTAHDERIDAVMRQLLVNGATTVADLGCGSGALLERLAAEPQFRRIVGVDSSARALLVAEQRLTSADGSMDPRLSLRQGSLTEVHVDLEGFDAVAMVETIEHLDPSHLGLLERSVFGRMRPRLVIITTPNREYNTLHGLKEGEYRHRDHRFEWDRKKFEAWATGVAGRSRYTVSFEGVGPANRWFGSSTQMATFRRGIAPTDTPTHARPDAESVAGHDAGAEPRPGTDSDASSLA